MNAFWGRRGSRDTAQGSTDQDECTAGRVCSMESRLDWLKRTSELVMEYDIEKNQMLLIKSVEGFGVCGTRYDYASLFKSGGENFVHPLDREVWSKFASRESYRNFLASGEAMTHYFIRFSFSTSSFVWFEVRMERLSDTQMLLAFRNAVDNGKNRTIVRALDREYDYVCWIDVHTHHYVLYPSETARARMPERSADDYDAEVTRFNNEYIVPEQAAAVTAAIKIENLVRELETKKEFIVYASVQEDGRIAHKKTRYCYMNEKREEIIACCTDVSDLYEAQQQRSEAERRRLIYLEEMPVAFCTLQVELNELGRPKDFRFLYSNRAHADLLGVKPGELVGRRYSDVYAKCQQGWLDWLYETAYLGIPHTTSRWNDYAGKFLLTNTFQVAEGQCGCVVHDLTEMHFLEAELVSSREKLLHLLSNTTELVFQFDLARDRIILFDETGAEGKSYPADGVTWRMSKNGLLESEHDRIELERVLHNARSGAPETSIDFRARLMPGEPFRWLRVTMFTDHEPGTHESCVLGYIQNIDSSKTREEALRREAQRDPLTGILNARAARSRILERLGTTEQGYNVLIIMDLDDFKRINDSCGHMRGDEALRSFASALKHTFRARDVIYRLGGDEFAVFVDHVQQPEETISHMMDRLHTNLNECSTEDIALSASGGAFASRTCCDYDHYYAKADAALYETKRRRKGDYTLLMDPETDE